MHRGAGPPYWKCICINYQFWGPAPRCIYPPNRGPEDTCEVQSSLCVCVSASFSVSLSLSPSLYLSVRSSASLFGDQSAQPVIACIPYCCIYLHIYIYICVTEKNRCIATLDPHNGNVFVFICRLELAVL